MWNISISPHHRLFSFIYEVSLSSKYQTNKEFQAGHYRRPTSYFSTWGLSLCLSISICSWPYFKSHVRHYSEKRHGAPSHQPLWFPAIRFPVAYGWHIWRRYNLITYSWCVLCRNKLMIFRVMCCLFWEAYEIHKHMLLTVRKNL